MSQVRVRRLSFYVFSTCQYSVVGSQTSYLGHVSNPLFPAGFQSNDNTGSLLKLGCVGGGPLAWQWINAQAYPWDMQFFFFPGGVFPTLGHVQEDNSPPPFESHGDSQTIAKQDIFRTFTNVFQSFMREGYYTYVVKT